jgi:hypothetical protein
MASYEALDGAGNSLLGKIALLAPLNSHKSRAVLAKIHEFPPNGKVTLGSMSEQGSVLHALTLLAKGTENKFAPMLLYPHQAQGHRGTGLRF